MSRALLSAFGLGFVPGAPGTLASAVALLVYSGMLWCVGPWVAGAACIVGCVSFGLVTVLAGDAAEEEAGARDPRWVVSDEVAGQFLAIALASWPWGVVGAFLGFRFLDVAKPFPISRLERLPGGWGILADDLAAGAAVLAGLRLADWLVPAWGLVHL